MTDKYWVGGSANWDGTAGLKWSLLSGGIGGAAIPGATDNVFLDGSSGAVTVTVAAGNTGCLNLSFATFTGTFAGSAALSASGNLTLDAGMSFTYTGTLSLTATSGPQAITSNTKAVTCPITLNGVGGTWQLADNFTTGSTRTVTLTNGALDLNGKTLSTGLFSSSNGNTRSITSGGGKITLTQNGATIWTTSTVTGFSLGDALQVESTYSGATGTRTITSGTLSEANSFSLKVTAGTDTVTPNSVFKNLDFSGFTGTWSAANHTVYGNLTLGSGMTVTGGNNQVVFAATSGTQVFTSNGVSFGRQILPNSSGTTVQFADAATLGQGLAAGQRGLAFNAGTIDLNGKIITTNQYVSAGTGTRTLKSSVNGGKIITNDTTAAGVSWSQSATNMTIDRATGTWTIEIGGNTANSRSFAGGGLTYPTVTFTNTTAAGQLSFTGSNTFKSLAYNGGTAQTFAFTAGTTTTIEDDNGFPTGTVGNVVTVTSTTAANHTLSKTSGSITCDYLAIDHSDAGGGATWTAGANSTNNGNNSGWIFAAPSGVVKTVNGLAYASVKTLDGLAAASVKKWNGMATQ